MADSKTKYSDSSNNYINKTVPNSENAQKDYNNSKMKEQKYNNEWSTQKVNINEVVEKFAPNTDGYVKGYKYIYESERYQVVADMVAGSLKIVDKKTNQPVKLNGKPGSRKETHYKIKKREEM